MTTTTSRPGPRSTGTAVGTNVDAVSALRSKIFKILTSANTPRNVYLSFVPGGLPQSDYTLKFLTDPSAVDQALEFALIANSVPTSTGDWVYSGTSMWDKYLDWLERYVPPKFSLTPDESARLQAAEDDIEKFGDDYDIYRATYNNAYFDWQEVVLMPKEDRPSNYARLLAEAKTKESDAKRNWETKGHKSAYETAYARMQDLSQRDPVRTKDRLKQHLGQPLTAPGGEYYPTGLSPSNLLDPNFRWPHFNYFSNETKTYSKDSSVSWGGNVSIGALLWGGTLDSSGKTEYHEKQSDVSNMSMEFDLLRAPILRPWFSTYLLFSRAWKWSSSTEKNPWGSERFSNGQLPGEGSWTMIPTEAIFVRNLTVKMDMKSEVNQKSLTETKSATEAGWGPFKIKGSVQTSHGSQKFEFAESGDGISCAQPQIIGFYCSLMPNEPNPDWQLWQE